MAGTQAEIDALLAEVQAQTPGVLESDGPGRGSASAAVAAPAASGSGGPGGGGPGRTPDERVRRILRIKVPLMVVLAQRKMPVREILNICIGSIIEFEKPFDEELELLVNNRSIAFGHAVKIGENFGLRVIRIRDMKTRIDALRTDEQEVD